MQTSLLPNIPLPTTRVSERLSGRNKSHGDWPPKVVEETPCVAGSALIVSLFFHIKILDFTKKKQTTFMRQVQELTTVKTVIRLL